MIRPEEIAAMPSPAQTREWDELMARDERRNIESAKAAKRAAWREECARAARFGIRPIPRLADTESAPAPHEKRHYDESEVIESLTIKRESEYVEHCINTAGHILPADKYAQSVRRRFVRWDQSTKLAAALIEGGARKAEARTNAPFLITLISRQVIELPIIPRVNFLPEVAAMRRSPMLKEVEAYAARNPLDRMATFTAGKRCPLPELRERTQAFTRKLSRLNSEKWFKPRASIPFRALEFGTPELDSASAWWTLHIHAHTILHVRRFIAPKKWRKFCRKISAFMGARWDGGRPIEDPREMVKYPVKPADLEKMMESPTGTAAICQFYTQTKGLRLVETLGDLRRSRSSIKNTKRKRVKERNAEGEWLPAVRRSWNAQGRSVTRRAIRVKRESVELRAAAVESIDAARGFCNLPESRELAPKMLNRIVARLAPGPFASPVYEPAAFVWNFTGDLDAICGHRSVSRVVEAVGQQVRESLAKVDAAKRRAGTAHNRPHQSHNCPGPIFEFPPPNAAKVAFRHHLEAIAT